MLSFPVMNILHIVVGFALCMFGSMMIRSSPRLSGFLLGGWVAAYIAYSTQNFSGIWVLIGPLGFFVLGGIIGMLLAAPLYMVIVVLSGTLLGAMIGFVIGFVVSHSGDSYRLLEGVFSIGSITSVQSIIMVITAVVFGLLSAAYQEFMTMLSTSYVGAALLGWGLVTWFGASTPLLRNVVFLFFAWAVVGILGTVYQYKNRD
ncbi:MAG: DUF4203 domain-containing protein [Anaerolineales bacterium]